MIPEAVRAYARRMHSTEYPSDDLVQDAALSIVRAGGARLTEAARLVVGFNAVRDQMRKLRTRRERGPVLADRDGPTRAPGPAAVALAQDARDAIEAGVGVRARQVLSGLLAGRSQAQAARWLDMTPGATHREVKSLRKRALSLGFC